MVYFLCGPLSALGFFLGGWCGFLLVLFLCLMFLCVKRALQKGTAQGPSREENVDTH